jgi:RNA polymerase sigma-70 factor, ECF subfamily
MERPTVASSGSSRPDRDVTDLKVITERAVTDREIREVEVREVIVAACQQHSAELERFLRGLLRSPDDAADCLQATFVKAIESGHAVSEPSLKAWLFRVAFNAAMEHKRKAKTGAKVSAQLANQLLMDGQAAAGGPAHSAIHAEEIERVRQQLANLPADQRIVVEKRIFEQKTFVEIAGELNVPLGTVLTRMRTALAKLQAALGADGQSPMD